MRGQSPTRILTDTLASERSLLQADLCAQRQRSFCPSFCFIARVPDLGLSTYSARDAKAKERTLGQIRRS